MRHSSGPAQEGREVHLLELGVAIPHAAAGDHLEALGLGDRLAAPVRLEGADDDVAPGLGLRLPLLQHAVGLADAGGHAEEDLVAAARDLPARALEDL